VHEANRGRAVGDAVSKPRGQGMEISLSRLAGRAIDVPVARRGRYQSPRRSARRTD